MTAPAERGRGMRTAAAITCTRHRPGAGGGPGSSPHGREEDTAHGTGDQNSEPAAYPWHMSSATHPTSPPILTRWWPAAAMDTVGVLAFVTIGRASHDENNAAVGIAKTAWPFLCGLLISWLVVRAWRRPAAIVPTGISVWLGTVAGGMVLRVLSGPGTAVTFVIVALTFNGIVLLGWRVLARGPLLRGRAPRGGAGEPG